VPSSKLAGPRVAASACLHTFPSQSTDPSREPLPRHRDAVAVAAPLRRLAAACVEASPSDHLLLSAGTSPARIINEVRQAGRLSSAARTANPSFHPDSRNHLFAQSVEGQPGAPATRHGVAAIAKVALDAHSSGLSDSHLSGNALRQDTAFQHTLARYSFLRLGGDRHNKLQLCPADGVRARQGSDCSKVRRPSDGPDRRVSILLAPLLIGARMHALHQRGRSTSPQRAARDAPTRTSAHPACRAHEARTNLRRSNSERSTRRDGQVGAVSRRCTNTSN
jgi:hypothetical protein